MKKLILLVILFAVVSCSKETPSSASKENKIAIIYVKATDSNGHVDSTKKVVLRY